MWNSDASLNMLTEDTHVGELPGGSSLVLQGEVPLEQLVVSVAIENALWGAAQGPSVSLLEHQQTAKKLDDQAFNGVKQRGETILGKDWEELSVVEDVEPDGGEASASQDKQFASEMVHNALVEEKTRAAPSIGISGIPYARQIPEELLQRSVSHGAPGRCRDQITESLVFAWGDNSSGQCLVGDSRRAVISPENIPLHCLCTSLGCGNSCSILVAKQGTL